MEDEYEFMKLLKHQDWYVFVFDPISKPHIINAELRYSQFFRRPEVESPMFLDVI